MHLHIHIMQQLLARSHTKLVRNNVMCHTFSFVQQSSLPCHIPQEHVLGFTSPMTSKRIEKLEMHDKLDKLENLETMAPPLKTDIDIDFETNQKILKEFKDSAYEFTMTMYILLLLAGMVTFF